MPRMPRAYFLFIMVVSRGICNTRQATGVHLIPVLIRFKLSCHCNHCLWAAYSAAQVSLGHPDSMVLAMTSVRNLLYGRRNDGRTLWLLLHDLHLTLLIRNKRTVPSSKYPCLITVPQPCTGPPHEGHFNSSLLSIEKLVFWSRRQNFYGLL